MEIGEDKYEQLNDGRIYFRYRSIVFEESGVRIGETLIEYPENIRQDEHSIALIKMILAARVIIDTYTLEQFLARAEKDFCNGYNIFQALPESLVSNTLGQFTGPMASEILNRARGIGINGLPYFNIKEIQLLTRLFEYKSRLAKFIEAEMHSIREGDLEYIVKSLKKKLYGHFFRIFPDITRTQALENILDSEVENAFSQLRDPEIPSNGLHLRDYDRGVKMAFKADTGNYHAQVYYSEGFNNTLGGSVILESKGKSEIYLSFEACPFPDVMAPLGEVYIPKCPIDHSSKVEQ